MSFVEWDDSYSVGVPILDSDHKRLFELTNDLHAAVSARKGRMTIVRILAGLEAYVQLHFRREEMLLEKTRYRDIESQKKAHAKFVSHLAAVQEKYHTRDDSVVSVQLLEFLKDWLINHIKHSDSKYTDTLLKNGLGYSDDGIHWPISKMLLNTKRGQLLISSTILIVFLLFSGVLVGHTLLSNNKSFDILKQKYRVFSEKVVVLQDLVQDINFDVVQIQQFLSDISATRGEDGLDDGFQEAEKYLQALRDNIAKSREVAASLNAQAVLEMLNKVSEGVPGYYAGGKAMATAYVERGTSAGNAEMKKFDEQANSFIELSKVMKSSILEYRNKETENFSAQIDVMLQSNVSRMLSISIISAASLILLVVTALVIIKVTGGLTRLSTVMLHLASGQSEVDIPYQDLRDELGVIARSVSTLKSSLDAVSEIQDSQSAAFDRLEEGAKRETLALSSAFERTIQELIEAVVAKAGEVHQTTSDVSGAVVTAQDKSRKSAEGAERAHKCVSNVVAQSERLNTSIVTINQLVTQSGSYASRAADEAGRSQGSVNALGEAVEQIGDIITLINEIASQTNLLALNATIEAARAGEAGKGFAVVASEVKGLAAQTSSATSQVVQRIDAIREHTNKVIDAIKEISSTICAINQSMAEIGSAVTLQNTATTEIEINVRDARSAMDGAATNIKAVDEQISATKDTTSFVTSSVDDMVRKLGDLRTGSDRFLTHIRSA